MDATDRREILRGPSFGMVQMLVQYRASFSTAAIMASSLAGVHIVRGRQGIYVCHLSHGDVAASRNTLASG
jgi:hypothetical protein